MHYFRHYKTKALLITIEGFTFIILLLTLVHKVRLLIRRLKIHTQLILSKVSLIVLSCNSLYNPRYEYIIENMRQIDIPFTVISETHNSQDQGALAMKSYYEMI